MITGAYFKCCVVIGCCALAFDLTAQPGLDVIEIRSCNLKPRSRSQFQKLFVEQALPSLFKWKADAVAYGPSLRDENSFFLARAYTNLNHRQQSPDTFYGNVDFVDYWV